MQNTVMEVYRTYRDRILEIRRHLHQNPELGDAEVETTAYIEAIVRALGMPVDKPLATGLTALLTPTVQTEGDGVNAPAADTPAGRPAGRCVAVRADIDALPIQEQCDLPFRSARDGVMHACGHDVHMAATLGAALVLADPAIRSRLQGPVKFLFQPAEETDGGAARMIAAGCLGEPTVDTVVGFHCEPGLPAGQIGVKYGYARASSDMFDIVIKGKSSHGAYPEDGVDAIVAASAIVLGVQSIASRSISAYEPCVITIGKFHGGQAENVVCDEVVLTGTMRTASPDVRERALGHLREIAAGTAAAYGATAELTVRPGYIALYNDPAVTERLHQCAGAMLGPERVTVLDRAMMSVDDFSFFAKERPSVYFFAGTGFAGRENAGLHHGAFEVDESALDTVVPLLVEYILQATAEAN